MSTAYCNEITAIIAFDNGNTNSVKNLKSSHPSIFVESSSSFGYSIHKKSTRYNNLISRHSTRY